MSEYRITFGLKYRHQQHPLFPAAHPDGWLTIIARNQPTARAITHLTLASDFAFHYPGPFNETEWARNHPLGEIARINASLTRAAVRA